MRNLWEIILVSYWTSGDRHCTELLDRYPLVQTCGHPGRCSLLTALKMKSADSLCLGGDHTDKCALCLFLCVQLLRQLCPLSLVNLEMFWDKWSRAATTCNSQPGPGFVGTPSMTAASPPSPALLSWKSLHIHVTVESWPGTGTALEQPALLPGHGSRS